MRPLRFSARMAEALSLGLKTQTRRPITATNCHVTGAEFDELALDTLHATDTPRLLQARAQLPGGARTVTVSSRVRTGDLLWPNSPKSSRASVAETIVVRGVRGQRVQDISDADAIAEGVAVYGIGTTAQPIRDVYESAWVQLVEHMAPRMRAMFLKQTDKLWLETRGTKPRDVFAALWVSFYGVASWRKNPWVWVYELRVVKTPPGLMQGDYAPE